MLDITREVVKAVNIPVTVKTRLGWDADNRIIVDLANSYRIAYRSPFHPRTYLGTDVQERQTDTDR